MLIALHVHPAGIQDREGVRPLLEQVVARLQTVKRVFFDSAYAGQLELWMRDALQLQAEVVRRLGGWSEGPEAQPQANNAAFSILPRRWVVERTFAWLGRYRRLSKDYEACIASSEAMIWFASLSLLTRRLAARSSEQRADV